MSQIAVTHSGPFHADDVIAWSLITLLWRTDLELVRSRDQRDFKRAEIIFDVGGLFEPDNLRFDHHQETYSGQRSSAGMVLDWLESIGRITSHHANRLRDDLVDYIDAVDIGTQELISGVPCAATLVAAFCQLANTEEQRLEQFIAASKLFSVSIAGMLSGYEQDDDAAEIVLAEMCRAEEEGRRVMFFDKYVRWKSVYYENGGTQHLTQFLVMPGTDRTWRVIAIPTTLGAFDQKRSLPEAWAGLTNQALEDVMGISGAIFCHKNRFLAVFDTLRTAKKVVNKFGLL